LYCQSASAAVLEAKSAGLDASAKSEDFVEEVDDKKVEEES
jgi:small subunit ribosomal protein S2